MRIHNIRSGRPEPEIEILYAVYQDEKVTLLLLLLFLMLFFCFVKVAFPVKIFCLPTRRKKRKNLNLKSAPWWKLKKRVSQDPVLAVEAVQVVDENVDQDQAVYSHLISFVFMFHIFQTIRTHPWDWVIYPHVHLFRFFFLDTPSR